MKEGESGMLMSFILLIAMFIIGFFVSKKNDATRVDAKVLDLMNKINDKKQSVAKQEATASSSLEEYEKLKKEFDSGDDHNDDGGGGNSAS